MENSFPHKLWVIPRVIHTTCINFLYFSPKSAILGILNTCKRKLLYECMIIFLYGEDSFRSRNHLQKMLSKFKADRDPSDLNSIRIDREAGRGSGVFEEIFAAPFLAEKRMVVLENFLMSATKDELAELLAIVEEKKLPRTTILVLWEARTKFNTKAAKELASVLAKEKYSQEFELLSGTKLAAYVSSLFSERGVQASREAVYGLEQAVGGDMWRLNSLVDQLCAFSDYGQREVSEDDVFCFVDRSDEDKIFALVDAIIARNGKEAFKLLGMQYSLGKDSAYVFAMILRQFRIMLSIEDAVSSGVDSKSIAKKLSLHPFVVNRTRHVLSRFSRGELELVYQSLVEYDIKVKTGKGKDKQLLEGFVLNFIAK